MGQTRSITAHFVSGRRYFENSLGNEFDFTQSTGPYEYLLGALSGCFYLTLLSIKHKSRWGEVTIDVNGTKRDALPSTLEKTELVITVKDAEDEEEFLSLARQAAAECSIYNTISQVSEMEWRVIFQ